MPKTDQRLAYVTAALAPLVNFAADEKNIAKSPKHPSAQTKGRGSAPLGFQFLPKTTDTL